MVHFRALDNGPTRNTTPRRTAYLACRFDKPAANATWSALLASKEFLTSEESDGVSRVYFVRTNGSWEFCTEPPTAHDVLTVSLEEPTDGRDVFKAGAGSRIETEFLTLFRLYLPLLLGGYHARRTGNVFITAHVAQSLDGRIACTNGHSQWISNEANLIHSHRLRALHDVVLVGGRTVKTDDPQLTVRHVTGENPVRVILSASGSVLKLQESRNVFDEGGATVICTTEARANIQINGHPGNVDLIDIEATDGPFIEPDAIAKVLSERGLHSVFLEGGSQTLSNFLQHGRIDILHVHVAPMILGSGIASFSLPEVSRVQDGQKLQMEHFEMEGELLFECRAFRS